MSKMETFKRYILFIISLFFSGLGIACTKVASIGVTTISSVANVLSIKFDIISMGNWLIIFNCVLVVGEILVLRRNFKLIQLLQVPLSIIFGYFTDLGTLIVSHIPLENYGAQMAMTIVGVIILGFGVSLAVIANVILNPGEAFVKAIADTLHKDFSNVKIVFDICCVALAALLSLILFLGNIVGIREGTLIAAVFTGLVVKFFTRLLKNPLEKLLK